MSWFGGRRKISGEAIRARGREGVRRARSADSLLLPSGLVCRNYDIVDLPPNRETLIPLFAISFVCGALLVVCVDASNGRHVGSQYLNPICLACAREDS